MHRVDWWNSVEPGELLFAIHRSAGPRELRRFACSCVRRIWSKYADVDALRAVVETAKSYAEGDASTSDLLNAQKVAETAINGVRIVETFDARSAAYARADADMTAMGNIPAITWLAAFSYSHPADYEERSSIETEDERVAQSHLLRDILPCQFRKRHCGRGGGETRSLGR